MPFNTSIRGAILSLLSLFAFAVLSNPVHAVEAESGTVSGATRVVSKSFMSGGAGIGYIGNGTANYVTIPVSVATAGSYTLTIRYVSGTARNLSWSVNG